MDNSIQWNYDEFVTFLLLYASHADFEFSEEERALIKSKVSTDTYDKIEKEFHETSDFQRLQKIIDCKGLFYPTPARKNELMDIMQKLFEADGEYSSLEKTLKLFLEKLL